MNNTPNLIKVTSIAIDYCGNNSQRIPVRLPGGPITAKNMDWFLADLEVALTIASDDDIEIDLTCKQIEKLVIEINYYYYAHYADRGYRDDPILYFCYGIE